MKKRVLALVLGCLLAVSVFSGCQSGGGASSSALTGTDVIDDGNPVGLQKYASPVTITTFLSSSDALERDFALTEDGETVEQNRYTKWFSEALNINISYDWIAKGTEAYSTKLNLAIASQELADVMMVTADQAQQLYKAGKILDLTEIYDKYATEDTKTYMKSDAASEGVFAAVTFDGKLYGIPKMWSSYDGAQFLWVRADWLKKYNLPEPKTMEDVITIAKRFVSEDTDGNGKLDTVGIGFTSSTASSMGGMRGFFNGYHSYLDLFLEQSGQLVFSNFLPETKNALSALQELYSAGAISKEYATTTQDALSELVTIGKCGLFYGEHWMPLRPLCDAVALDETAEWKAYALPSCDSTPASTQMTSGTTYWWVVNKDCKNPEALIKLINLSYTPESEAPDYVIKQDVSNYYSFNPFLVQDPLVNIKQMKGFKAYLAGEEYDGKEAGLDIKIEQYEKYKNGDQNYWWVDQIYGIEDCPIQILNDRYIGENLIVTNAYHGGTTNAMIKSSATLGKLIDQTLVEIITGSKDVSEWDNLQQRWLSLGGQSILNEINGN